MYPMRLHKREIQDMKEMREIFDECKVVRIGSCDGHGMFIVPMNFGYVFSEEDRQLKLYVHSACEGRKAEAFKKNMQVAFEMDCTHALIQGDYTCSYSYAYRSIMGNGTIHKIEENKEKIYGLKLLMENLAPEAEIQFKEEMLQRVAVYRIDVTEFTGKKREPK